MLEKFGKLWDNRVKILEGIGNSIFVKEQVEEIALRRTAICQSNTCGFYDQEGTSPKVVLPEHPACSICGCNIHLLVRSLSSECSLSQIGRDPLWPKILTFDEELNLPK